MDLYGKYLTLDGQLFFLSLPTGSASFEGGQREGGAQSGGPSMLNSVMAMLREGTFGEETLHINEWFWYYDLDLAPNPPPHSSHIAGRCIPLRWSTADNSDRDGVGWRPMLIPLTSDHRFNSSTFSKLPPGTVVKMYSLTMDDIAVRADVDGAELYQAGSTLKITDQFFQKSSLIQWLICDGVAIADRNLLMNVSWSDLEAQGFFVDTLTYCPGPTFSAALMSQEANNSSTI